MSFLGMGTLEILVVLLVAFIFLGPQRMVDAARVFGKVVAEVRRMTVDLPQLVMDEDPSGSDGSPKTIGQGGSQTASQADGPEEDNQGDDSEEPVAFRRTGRATQRNEPNAPAERREE